MRKFDRLDLSLNDSKELEDLKSELFEEAEQELNVATGFRSARVSPIKLTVPLEIKSKSAPVSPSKAVDVKHKIETFENFRANNHPNQFEIMTYKKEIETLACSRNAHKAWITRILNYLNDDKTNGYLAKQILEIKSEQIKIQISKIETLETQIAIVYDANRISPDAAERKKSLGFYLQLY